MRKITCLVLCLLIVISTLILTTPKVQATTTWTDTCEYVSTTTGLNARTGPGTSYLKIATITAGYQVLRLSTGSNGWSKVVVNGRIGYMSSQYLKKATYKSSLDKSGTVVSDLAFTRINETTYATENVNVRNGPGTSYGKLGMLNRSDSILRIGVGSNGWSQVIYKDTVGYIKSDYLSDTSIDEIGQSPELEKETIPTTPPQGDSYQVNANLNVRKGPGTSYKKIGCLVKGTVVYSLGKSGSWHRINYNGQTAYVSGSYLTKVFIPDKPQNDPIHEEATPTIPEAEGVVYYTTTALNVRTGPSTSHDRLGTMAKGTKVVSYGTSSGWHKIIYNNQIAYCFGSYLTKNGGGVSTISEYPKTYKDSTCTITIYKEWWNNAYVYAAHIQYTDYTRLWMECANGKYNSGGETTSAAARRVGAIIAINGDYATPGNGAGSYAIARNGVVCNDQKACPEGIYNSKTGVLLYGQSKGISGEQLSTLVKEGKVTDTFQFGPCFLLDGKIIGDKSSTSRAQRTFIGTNGNAGDIWLCVSDGRYNDGKSAGLNAYECATYLQSKGCTLGVPLDGGGSSTMYFDGQVLNAAKSGQRAVADFLMFK